MILNVTQVVKRAGLPGRLSKAMQQGIYAEESWWSRVSFSGNTAAQVCTEISKNSQVSVRVFSVLGHLKFRAIPN